MQPINRPLVLVVEDEQNLSFMYKKKFEIAGFGVECAGNGIDGLEKANELLPDIILLDIMMPKMNGLDMLRQLKASGVTRDIPVVMLSNISEGKQVEQARQIGAKGYIIKADVVPQNVVDIIKQELRL